MAVITESEDFSLRYPNLTRLDQAKIWLNEHPTTKKVLIVAAVIFSPVWGPIYIAAKILIGAKILGTSLASAVYSSCIGKHRPKSEPVPPATVPAKIVPPKTPDISSPPPIAPVKEITTTTTTLSDASPKKENPLSRKLRALDDPTCDGIVEGIYITTNEIGLEKTRAALLQTPKTPQSCHIGFASWHNFDIIAMRRSDFGLICDFYPKNKIFIEETLKILKSSPTRQVFVEKMQAYVKEINQDARRKLGTPAHKNCIRFSINHNLPDDKNNKLSDEARTFALELNREGSWLADDASFKHIRDLAREDRLVAITANIRTAATFKQVAKLYQDAGITIDSLYLSNICNYMMSPPEKTDYASTVRTLMQDETIVIHCPKEGTAIKNETNSPVQRVDLGKTLMTSENTSQFFKTVV